MTKEKKKSGIASHLHATPTEWCLRSAFALDLAEDLRDEALHFCFLTSSEWHKIYVLT